MTDPTGPPTAEPPALFDVTTATSEPVDGALVRIQLDELELAPNARREIDPESIERLARMLASMGQLVPCIGHRPAHDPTRVVLYAGQRRCSPPGPATRSTASHRSAACSCCCSTTSRPRTRCA